MRGHRGRKLPCSGASLLSDLGHRAASCINSTSAVQTPPKLSAQRATLTTRALLAAAFTLLPVPPLPAVSSQPCEVPPVPFALLLGTSGAPVQQKDLIACQN